MKRIKFDIDPSDEVTGVKAISLVDDPAMKSDFIAMAAERGKFIELKTIGYKQVLAGMALIPEKDFLRVDAEGKQYLAYFSAESIEKIRNKFHKEQMTSNVNIDHSQQDFIDAYLIESFIIDSPERLADVTTKGIKDAVIGAWFVAYKIDDEKVFQEALDGKLKGFSVEIFVRKVFKEVPCETLADSKLNTGDKVIIKPGTDPYMEEIIFTVVEVSKEPAILLRAGQGMSLRWYVQSELQKVEVTQLAKKGKSKGIFERRLKMIESEINN